MISYSLCASTKPQLTHLAADCKGLELCFFGDVDRFRRVLHRPLHWLMRLLLSEQPLPYCRFELACPASELFLLVKHVLSSQNLSGKEYIKKLASSRASVEDFAAVDRDLITSTCSMLADDKRIPSLKFRRVAFTDMLECNSVLLARLEALGGYEVTTPTLPAVRVYVLR